MRRSSPPASSAYVSGLKLLARRELSEHQLRERLARYEYAAADVDEAIDRLKAERALDDTRAAAAMARYEILTRGHGRLRAQRRLQQAGIASAAARTALDDVCQGMDAATMIGTALQKRLRGDRRIADAAEFRRLYRFLVAQGFEPDQVMAALNRRRPGRALE